HRHVLGTGRRLYRRGPAGSSGRTSWPARRARHGRATGMSNFLRNWQSVLALALVVTSFAFLPTVSSGAGGTSWPIVLLLVAGPVGGVALGNTVAVSAVLFIAAHGAVWLLLSALTDHAGGATPSFWLLLAASWLLAWRLVTVLSTVRTKDRRTDILLRLFIPFLFGAWLLILWEAIVRGAGIPFVLLPPPSAVAARFANSLPILAADVNQTIFKAVLFGYVVGCGAGFLAAIVADRFTFMRRGLLPIGNLVSALPIIGIAPIMVMWFGFDWQSKAAVVIIMTFFPMLVNTVTGLAAAGHMERDLMRT